MRCDNFCCLINPFIEVYGAIAFTEKRTLEKKPLVTPEVLVPDLVSSCYYNLSLVISR
ncbi:MAG: hypothetical protein V7L01_22080 [Nostoc sp.]|uniref:hypothetical protein n=1 Tax=Nostoc sp. TaxID=1180 RepID=UPI002FFC384A